ncbi:hypothetical protein ELH05_01135 [Rhizobium ruizarguesonis]|uniref:hypothetical protein n=1 Tax=Rhizobium ruizarguesonis TaxID=2081791 RepID=UPI0010312BCC|nr:hypothetical protein [Rhizobium ruizarguesonis]TBE26565.1 hypothetical protein ELH05_01135 [Rhizobium ruizarguesonis]
MRNSGFTQEHFDLLATHGGKPWTKAEIEIRAKDTLGIAYEATKNWAKLLQAKRFPEGYADGAKHVIVRGHHFSPYTWWRVYPRRNAPVGLTYTVGIDQSGDFLIKMDTYQASRAMRTRYEMECGPRYEEAPFWSVLPAHKGLSMSEKELIDWSIDQIDRFRPTYDELYRRITDVPILHEVHDSVELDHYFQTWIRYLVENAERSSNDFEVTTGEFQFTSSISQGKLASKLRLSADGPWLVEINQTKLSSSSASLSAIAKDNTGRAYLLRRGRLQSNGRDKGVTETIFAARSGLPSVSLSKDDGSITDDTWYVVAALSEAVDIVIATTAQFVRACARAREADLTETEKPPVPAYFVSTVESGGSYLMRAQTFSERTIRRMHGDVWQHLWKRLNELGVNLIKCRHPLGYEIDGVFQLKDGREILIEIKTDSSASSIHAAVGQLHLYPALMPRLKNTSKYLLLPSPPDRDLVKAIEDLGISVYTYAAERADSGGVFQEFIDTCVREQI